MLALEGQRQRSNKSLFGTQKTDAKAKHGISDFHEESAVQFTNIRYILSPTRFQPQDPVFAE